MKEIIKVGNLRNESQSGIVLSRGGVLPTEYSVQWKDPPKTIRRVDSFGWYREKREREQRQHESD